MVNSHSGDTYNMRGLIMGHYPLLKLPVATSIYMSKLRNDTAEYIWELDDEDKKRSLYDWYLQGKHFGNIDPDFEGEITDQQIHIEKKIPADFIEKYGNIEFKTPLPPLEILSKDEKNMLNYLIKLSIKKGEMKLQKKVKSIMKFVINEIEGKYSKMLTP